MVSDPPSPFVAQWIPTFADLAVPRRALDVAMGRGRHLATLAAAGFRVFGVDLNFDAVLEGVRRQTGPDRIRAWCADLTRYPLPIDHFQLVLVTRYLQRDLFPALRAAVTVGGAIVYETFTTAQRRHGRGPTSPDHLLEPGELHGYFGGFEVMFYEEVINPDAVARIVARKRGPLQQRF